MDAEKIKNWRERVGIEPLQDRINKGFAGHARKIYMIMITFDAISIS